jgi:hypothetical protein
MRVHIEDAPRSRPWRGGPALRTGVEAGPVQGTNLGLAFIHRTTTELHSGPYGLLGAELPYRPPASVEVYEKFFGAPVRVGGRRPAAVLRILGRLAEHRLTGVNDVLRQLALATLGGAGAAPPWSGPVLPYEVSVRTNFWDSVQGALRGRRAGCPGAFSGPT